MRARRRKADLDHVVVEAAGVEDGAAAAFAVGVDQIADRRIESLLEPRRSASITSPRFHAR